MKRKLLSTLLCLCLLFSAVIPGVASAETDPVSSTVSGETESSVSDEIIPAVNFTNVAPFLDPVIGQPVRRLMARAAVPAATNTDNGMVINKTAVANDDGTYTITLEAYATGEKVITEVSEDIPTDIVLVLDQSGSMEETMSTYGFREYTGKSNSYLYNRRHNNNGNNGNLYYPLGDGTYATVSVVKQETLSPEPLSADLVNYRTSWGNLTTDCYYYYADNLYEKVGEEYKKVSLTRQRISTGIFSGYYQYTYTFSNGESISSNGNDESPDLGSHGPLYYNTVDATKTVYTYTYTDKDGVTQTIGTSTGADTQPTDFTLYERYQTGSKTRLEALKTAVTSFANSVAEKAKGADGTLGTDDDVNHRIAVVGFASGNPSNTLYYNSEVFVGSNQYQYNTTASDHYSEALQSMNTTQGKDNITASINALDAEGATFTNLGMEMANGVLDANPVQTGEKRNRVIIVFTDGVPGRTDWDSTVANNAINQAQTAKDNGVTVYTVGVFSGADATSAGSSSGTDTQKANWFMQNLSSNNGKVQTPSYYLSAADAGTLNNIFQQISDQIESGGSSTTLDSKAVIRDIIAPQFALPAGATASNITLKTYHCTGKSGDAYTWSENSGDAMGATATVNGDQVSVTGFNFTENYVGTVTEGDSVTYRGDKLVISFTVSPKPGFLGGNNVYTNAGAGVYENSDATQPVLRFPQPQVNVPIDNVAVTAADKNVYLLGNLTAAQLKEGATVKVGEGTKAVSLDLSKANENYGLEDWQTEYVNITVTVKDKDGNPISDKLENLTEDTTYTVEVTVAPKTAGTSTSEKGDAATAKTGANSPASKINVFKPELIFKDSEVYYGDTVPAAYNNLTSTVWKHGETLSNAEGVTMIGTAPTLSLTYTPEEDKIAGGKINTKQDIAVGVTVKINETDVTTHTTFQHTNCTDKVCTLPNGAEFLLHVKTCTLKITKEGGTDGEPYVFNIKKGNDQYTQATITGNGSVTICELPVGEYTIEEDTNWSWRFTSTTSGGVTLSKDNTSGTITCTNTQARNSWLNGFSRIVQNICGVSSTSSSTEGGNR